MSDGPLKAISLWQPWATGIANGVKLIETRHWSTPLRGEIAIHAAKRWDADQRAFAEDERALGTIGFGLPFGAIVAIATLRDVKRTEQLAGQLTEQEERWGNYGPRRFGWLFTDVRPCGPLGVLCVGRQGIWSLDDETTRAVRLAAKPKHPSLPA
jgi:hypothetical protein